MAKMKSLSETLIKVSEEYLTKKLPHYVAEFDKEDLHLYINTYKQIQYAYVEAGELYTRMYNEAVSEITKTVGYVAKKLSIHAIDAHMIFIDDSGKKHILDSINETPDNLGRVVITLKTPS